MWTEICDECGEEVKGWYDLRTSYICESCLERHRVDDGKCDFCGEESPFWLYNIDNIRICDKCIEFYKRGQS